MKVILKGINYQDVVHTVMHRKWYALLHQLSFPIEAEVIDDMVCLKNYIKDPESPNSSEEWGLVWFIYEEVKKIQD